MNPRVHPRKQKDRASFSPFTAVEHLRAAPICPIVLMNFTPRRLHRNRSVGPVPGVRTRQRRITTKTWSRKIKPLGDRASVLLRRRTRRIAIALPGIASSGTFRSFHPRQGIRLGPAFRFPIRTIRKSKRSCSTICDYRELQTFQIAGTIGLGPNVQPESRLRVL